jgi:hypothetical protein
MPAATTAVPIAEPAAAAAIATMPRAAAAAADEAVAELMSPEDEAAADALNAETFEEPLSQPGQLQWLLSLESWWWWWCVQYQVLGWIVHVRGFDDATRRSIAAEAAAKRAAQAELWRWGSPTELKVKQQRVSAADPCVFCAMLSVNCVQLAVLLMWHKGLQQHLLSTVSATAVHVFRCYNGSA